MLRAGNMPSGPMQKIQNELAFLPGRGQAHAGYLRGFSHCIEARGGRANELLEPFDLNSFALEQAGTHLSCHTVVELLETSSRKTNDSILGFRLAEAQEPDILGCAIPLARAAPDFGSAIEQLIRFLPYTHSQESNLQLLVGQRAVELRWSSPVELDYCEQAYYHHLFIIHKLLAMLGGSEFRATGAALRCDVRATDLETMSAAMGCQLQSRADANFIAFDRDQLRRPLRTADALTFDILRNALEALANASSESLTERVHSYVVASLPQGRCTIEDCASKLGTSSRTLQKRLTEQHTTFSELVEQTRIEIATRSLAFTSQSISEIALDLGYSEHSCFTRAFKGWTGQTPEEFRQGAMLNRRH